ncbi:MAG: phage holin family protein [Armatimonadetes bacterium]|nr:phage holin family protein [Armatimonadota bacterium]
MLKRWLAHWITGVLAVAIAVWLAKQIGFKIEWPSMWRMVLFVPTLAIVNGLIGPALRILSLPITCLTFGLFGFVVNALVFWIAGLITGATMNFWSALFGSIVVTLVGGTLSRMLNER